MRNLCITVICISQYELVSRINVMILTHANSYIRVKKYNVAVLY